VALPSETLSFVVDCVMRRVCSACAARRGDGKRCVIGTSTCSETCTIKLVRVMLLIVLLAVQ